MQINKKIIGEKSIYEILKEQLEQTEADIEYIAIMTEVQL